MSALGKVPGWRFAHPEEVARPLGDFRAREVELRLRALGLILALLAFVASSTPHLVHHLGDGSPHPDCYLSSLLQHTTAVKSTPAILPPPLPDGEHLGVAPYRPTIARPSHHCWSRAPPTYIGPRKTGTL